MGDGAVGHGHGPASGAAPDQRRPLLIAFGVSVVLLVAEVVGSVLTGSLALLTDAAHVLTDTVGLGIALLASTLMLRPASAKRTWGFRRVEVLAAQMQAAVLLAVAVFVAVEGVRRLTAPPEVPAMELLAFGVLGLLGNLVSVGVLLGQRRSSFNLRAAFLEALNDALGSVGVIVAAVVIATTGWGQADAVAGLLIAALIVPRAFVLLRETTSVLLEFTPAGLDLDDVRRHMLEVEHVQSVHELHASTVASGLPVLSAHVVVADECFADGHAPEILRQLKECVSSHFEIDHSTIELEPPGFAAVDPHQHD
jgi:cobalt-zinc-cadmium efflux system protein